MAVPKGKVSSARRDKRRASNYKAVAVSLVKCSKCGDLRRAHTVCKTCGSYNKREIIQVAE
jgi:large subunit ribosomal protein L32